MTTLTIRPTQARFVLPGSRIRIEGITVTVRQIYGAKACAQPYGQRPNLPGEMLYTIIPSSCAPFTVQGTHVLDVLVEEETS